MAKKKVSRKGKNKPADVIKKDNQKQQSYQRQIATLYVMNAAGRFCKSACQYETNSSRFMLRTQTVEEIEKLSMILMLDRTQPASICSNVGAGLAFPFLSRKYHIHSQHHYLWFMATQCQHHRHAFTWFTVIEPTARLTFIHKTNQYFPNNFFRRIEWIGNWKQKSCKKSALKIQIVRINVEACWRR